MNVGRGVGRVGIVALCVWEIGTIAALAVALWNFMTDPMRDARETMSGLNEYLATAICAGLLSIAGFVAFFTARWIVRGFAGNDGI